MGPGGGPGASGPFSPQGLSPGFQGPHCSWAHYQASAGLAGRDHGAAAVIDERVLGVPGDSKGSQGPCIEPVRPPMAAQRGLMYFEGAMPRCVVVRLLVLRHSVCLQQHHLILFTWAQEASLE